jgi:hypothetical protein
LQDLRPQLHTSFKPHLSNYLKNYSETDLRFDSQARSPIAPERQILPSGTRGAQTGAAKPLQALSRESCPP